MDILTNKQYKEYERISRYSVVPFYYNRVDDKYIYGLSSQLKKEDTKYVIHKVKDGDTYDTLSLYYYNSPLYYWVICDFNDIQDPYINPEVGTTLRIPTFSDIQFIV